MGWLTSHGCSWRPIISPGLLFLIPICLLFVVPRIPNTNKIRIIVHVWCKSISWGSQRTRSSSHPGFIYGMRSFADVYYNAEVAWNQVAGGLSDDRPDGIIGKRPGFFGFERQALIWRNVLTLQQHSMGGSTSTLLLIVRTSRPLCRVLRTHIHVQNSPSTSPNALQSYFQQRNLGGWANSVQFVGFQGNLSNF